MILILEIGKKYPEITGPLSDQFTNELRNASENGEFSELVLDFKGTQVISSMAMSALFSTYQRLKTDGKTLRIVNTSEKVTRLLRMVDMTDMLR